MTTAPAPREPVVLPIRDINVLRDAKDSTATPTLLRVFRDHESGVAPMYFVDFITLMNQKARRGLIPIVDIDAPMLAAAIMRMQEEHAEMVAAWHANPEGTHAPSGAFIPPRTHMEEEERRLLPSLIIVG